MRYEDARKLFPMMDYAEKFNAICEKEDRINNIRSAADQYEA